MRLCQRQDGGGAAVPGVCECQYLVDWRDMEPINECKVNPTSNGHSVHEELDTLLFSFSVYCREFGSL